MKTSPVVSACILTAALGLILSGCSASNASAAFSSNSAAVSSNSAAVSSSPDTSAGLESAQWSEAMTVTQSQGQIEIIANGIPNHKRDAQYAVPQAGVMVPDASTATIADDPTKAQNYDFVITTKPKYLTTTTSAPLGSIGIMVSGSVLFNPYEGDGKTVAMANNFSLPDASGNKVWFVDSCSGHPTPGQGEYHYHALSSCVASEVDTPDGPSHILGLALDGFPIYGANDINGKAVPVSSLDECNGISSPTPEFPNGIYHYVLPGTSDETSSIRCFHGEVDASQIKQMPAMGMPPR